MRIILAAVALIILVVAALTLNNSDIIKVVVKGSTSQLLNKLKIDLEPEDVIVGDEVKIIIKDQMGNPVEKARVYVTRDHYSSAKIVCVGETDSSGMLVYLFEDEGQYRIYVEKEGFYSQERLVNVKLRGALSFSIRLMEARGDERFEIIRITSDRCSVEKAEVYVNGTLIGYTNSSGEISSSFKLGKVYEIIIRKRGYRGLLVILDMNPEGGTGTIIRPLKNVYTESQVCRES